MDNRTKIVVGMEPSRKAALERVLRDRGLSYKEWIDEKIDESLGAGFNPDDPSIERPLVETASPGDQEVVAQFDKIDWAFSASDTTYLSHNIHPYPAKFIPQIPRNIIRLLSTPGELVWDPFGGAGTTALEALILGRRAISSDLNPVAKVIGEAKTATVTSARSKSLIDFASQVDGAYRAGPSAVASLMASQFLGKETYAPDIPNIEKWFHPSAIRELAYLKATIRDIEPTVNRAIALAAFSRVIVRASFQDSETRYVSKPREVDPGEVLHLFALDLKSIVRKLRNSAPFIRFREARFVTADLRNSEIVAPSSVDLVVTSPPYPNSTDYHLYHRFRLFWLDDDPRKMSKREIGSHLRHQREDSGIENYKEEMTLCLERIAQALSPGRYAVLVVGDGVYKGATYRTAEILNQEAPRCGLRPVGEVGREVHQTKRSFISPARRIRSETMLILQRPSSETTYWLVPPSYKAWPYEHDLQRLESAEIFRSELESNSTDDLSVVTSAPIWRRLSKLAFTHGLSTSGMNSITSWQAILENGVPNQEASSSKNSKYLTHGIHDYKGKFYPQLAKSLLAVSSLPTKARVFDPFCGSGTLILESYLAGHTAIGTDVNPMAIRISKAKLDVLDLDPAMVDDVLSEFIEALANLDYGEEHSEEFARISRPELEAWFPAPVILKLGSILRRIRQIPNPALQNLIHVCLSSIIREISQQEPRDLRIRRRKSEIDDAPVSELLIKRLKDARTNLKKFWKTSNWAPDPLGTAQLELADCRDTEALRNIGLFGGEIDAVITSPPYATALPYIDTDRLSLLAIDGLSSAERKPLEESLIGSREITKRKRLGYEELIEMGNFGAVYSPSAISVIKELHSLNNGGRVGFRRRNKAALLYRYYTGMCTALDNLNELVRPGGSLIFVVGDNWTKAGGRKVAIPTTKFLLEEAKTRGWNLNNSIPITVTRENRVHRRNSITDNQILHFSKH